MIKLRDYLRRVDIDEKSDHVVFSFDIVGDVMTEVEVIK